MTNEGTSLRKVQRLPRCEGAALAQVPGVRQLLQCPARCAAQGRAQQVTAKNSGEGNGPGKQGRQACSLCTWRTEGTSGLGLEEHRGGREPVRPEPAAMPCEGRSYWQEHLVSVPAHTVIPSSRAGARARAHARSNPLPTHPRRHRRSHRLSRSRSGLALATLKSGAAGP